jgi:hypothetical protein
MTTNTNQHLIPRLVAAPFVYTIGFLKAARVPNRSKKVAFEESKAKGPHSAARRPSLVGDRAVDGL